MKVLLFSDTEIWEVLKLLAALLHIGNVKYRATVVGEETEQLNWLFQMSLWRFEECVY